MFENEILRLRLELLNEDLHGLCSLPSIIRMIKDLEGEIDGARIKHGR
jgi:hypothetical protein